MLQYEGAECPFCHQTLHDGDDITVCPICGAPYHRECAKKAGGCVREDLHKEGRQWERVSRPGASSIDGLSERRCSRCGTIASPGERFCQICGNPLENEKPNNQSEQGFNQNASRSGGMLTGNGNNNQQGFQPPYQMPFDPFSNPFGGLDPEETIEDVPAKDLAVYVKQNTPYFLPKFKAFFRKEAEGAKRTFSWNWAAFLLDTYYLFYRKMYGLGILVLILSTLLSIPSLLISFDNLMTMVDSNSTFILSLGISADKLLILYNFCSFLSFVLKATVAALFNKLYAKHAVADIKKIRTAKTDENEYHAALSAKGGVSFIGVLLAVAATVVISLAISSFCLSFIQ